MGAISFCSCWVSVLSKPNRSPLWTWNEAIPNLVHPWEYFHLLCYYSNFRLFVNEGIKTLITGSAYIKHVSECEPTILKRFGYNSLIRASNNKGHVLTFNRWGNRSKSQKAQYSNNGATYNSSNNTTQFNIYYMQRHSIKKTTT